MGKKVYAVRKGKKSGIFGSWAECQKQVTGFPGAEFKSFLTRKEAERFLAGEKNGKPFGCQKEGLFLKKANKEGTSIPLAYVDGSFDKLSRNFSYGMVILYQGEERKFCQKFCDPELAQMHNVAGEIKGSEAAVRYALEKGWDRIVIYHDYEGVAKWCNGAWKANREGTKAYKAYFDSIKNKITVEFVKVKGHSNDTYNDMADALAKQALGLGSVRYGTEAFWI